MGSRLDRVTDWEARAQKARYSVFRLAVELNMTERQLERHFSKAFGTSPKVWLDDLKMLEAERLLALGLLIKEIASRLGFKNSTHFSRALSSAALSNVSRRTIFYLEDDNSEPELVQVNLTVVLFIEVSVEARIDEHFMV